MTVGILVGTACGTTGTNDPRADDPSSDPEVDPDSGVAADVPDRATAPTSTMPPGGWPVESRVERWVDDTRPTRTPDGTVLDEVRVLETSIWAPEAEGEFPLIVFSHGFMGHPEKFSGLLRSWAAAGYVVAAPTFPITNDRYPAPAPGNWAGIVDQPADVSFTIDQVLAANDDTEWALAGRVDPDRIGVGGLSLGGGTTYGVAFGDCCRDDRVDAVEILSGMLFPLGGEFELGSGLPLLIVHGTADLALPYDAAVTTYGEAAAPKFFVTFEGGTHAPPFEDDDSPHDAVAEAVTIAFWDTYLRTAGGSPDEGALERLVEAASADPDLSRIEYDTTG